MKNSPQTITYANDLPRETFRLALTIDSLNGLQVKAHDIMNSYSTAPITENIWTVLGSEFVSDCGKKAIDVRALYGLKSSGAEFCNNLADSICHMG